LANNRKHDPEAMRPGQIYWFLYGILVPYNLPHMLVYSYRMEFRLISHKAVQHLTLTLRSNYTIHRSKYLPAEPVALW